MKNKEFKNYGSNYRMILFKDFSNFLNSCSVLSGELRSEILNLYMKCTSRVYDLCKNKKYDEISSDELEIEMKNILTQLRYLSIFSDKFINVIHSHFFNLINSFNPSYKFD